MRFIPNTVLRCDETSRHTILYIGAYYCPFLHDSNIITPAMLQLQKLARV